MRKAQIVLAALASLALFTTPASASLIAPGGGVPATPTVIDPGAFIHAQVTTPVSGVNAANVLLYTAQVYNAVIQETVAYNALGGLSFVIQGSNSQSSLDAISRITTTGFGGFLTDVSYASSGGGAPFSSDVAPLTADRSGTLGGSRIGWNFSSFAPPADGILPGQDSFVLVIRTNATAYDLSGTVNTINGAVATIQSFAPRLAVVPEPSSLALGTVALLGVGGWQMKRLRRYHNRS